MLWRRRRRQSCRIHACCFSTEPEQHLELHCNHPGRHSSVPGELTAAMGAANLCQSTAQVGLSLLLIRNSHQNQQISDQGTEQPVQGGTEQGSSPKRAP